MLLEFTCLEIMCFLENDSLKISKKMVSISSEVRHNFNVADAGSYPLSGVIKSPFSLVNGNIFTAYPRKRKRRITYLLRAYGMK